MADGTTKGQKRVDPGELTDSTNGATVAVIEVKRGQLRDTAARLYAQGYKRKDVAKILLDHLCSDMMQERPYEQRIAAARGKLRRWEESQWFRDAIYKQGLIALDLQAPAIMKGVAKKARAGRVDAARLAFELTGRHNPKGEQAPAQIAVVVNGVPRPQRAVDSPDTTAIEVEAVEADG